MSMMLAISCLTYISTLAEVTRCSPNKRSSRFRPSTVVCCLSFPGSLVAVLEEAERVEHVLCQPVHKHRFSLAQSEESEREVEAICQAATTAKMKLLSIHELLPGLIPM